MTETSYTLETVGGIIGALGTGLKGQPGAAAQTAGSALEQGGALLSAGGGAMGRPPTQSGIDLAGQLAAGILGDATGVAMVGATLAAAPALAGMIAAAPPVVGVIVLSAAAFALGTAGANLSVSLYNAMGEALDFARENGWIGPNWPFPDESPPDGLPDSPPGFGDPIVFDLNGDGVSLSSTEDSNAHFDFSGTGFAVKTGWITEGDGLLILDDGLGDGHVTASELVGALSGNSFADLSVLDTNADGVLNTEDSAFSQLKIWVDTGLDGIASSSELHSLIDLRITTINLNSVVSGASLNGNVVVSNATYTYLGVGGAPLTGAIAEVVFGVDRQMSVYTPPPGFELDPQALNLPEMVGYGLLPDFSVAMSLNPDLMDAAESLVLNGSSMSATDFKAAFEQMIFEWADAANIDPSSRGEFIDARHMAVIYAYYGIDPVADPQFDQDPNWHNGPTVWEPLYQDILAQMQTRFVAQIAGSQLLNGVSAATVQSDVFYAFSGLHFVSSTDRLAFNFEYLFDDLSTYAPADPALAASYWQRVLPIVRGLEVEFETKEDFVQAVGIGSVAGVFSSYLQSGLFSSLGITRVIGGATNDNLAGGSAAEYIAGLAGNDTLSGGGGNDTFVWSRGDGDDQITDNADLNSNDILILKGVTPSQVTLVRSGDSVSLVISESEPNGADGGTITLVNTLRSYLSRGIEQVLFEDGTIWTPHSMRVALLAQGSTNGNDNITGFNVDDVITGGGGNDALNGVDGHDTYVYARGDGHDTITDNSELNSTDRLVLEDINPSDVTISRTGDDVTIVIAESSPGAGDAGSVRLVATLKSYLARGIEQVVFANGTIWTPDTMRVALLAQTSTGGNDVITGFNVADTITGGAGNDTINGGDGSDTYIYARGHGYDSITDSAELNSYDRLILSGIGVESASLTRSGDDVTVVIAESAPGAGDGGAITLVAALRSYLSRGVEEVVFEDGTVWTPASMREAILDQSGTPGNDTITGFNTADTIRGRGGNDIISGGDGNDTYIYARGDGDDQISDAVILNTGDQLILEGINSTEVSVVRVGNDVKLVIAESSPGAGDGGSITLPTYMVASGNRGIDQIVFADGNIWWMGNIRAQASNPSNTAPTITSNGGGSTAAIAIYENGTAVTSVVATDVNPGTTLTYSIIGGADASKFTINASTGVLTFKAAPNFEAPTDAGANNVYDLVVQVSDGVLPDHQTIAVTVLDVIENGGTITGTSGNDTLTGTTGGETIKGLAGNDVINGAGGNDTLIGGAGADVLNGGDGFDVVSYETASSGVYIHSGNLAASTGDAAGDTFSGIEGARGSAFADEFIFVGDNPTLYGGAGNDTLTVVGFGSQIYGEAGNDGLFGGAGNDDLFGGADNDTISGGGGNDRLDGGTGNDWLIGGDGNDMFVFAASSGADGISDFTVHGGSSSGDSILLQGQSLTSFAAVLAAATEWNGTTYLHLDGGAEVALHGVTKSQLTSSDFSFI